MPAAAASPCASTPGGNDVIYTASDPTPATVTSPSRSTIATITFTSKTYFDYLYPVFSIDARNNDDGIKPTYTPPSYEYSMDGGSWKSIAAAFDTSGTVGGDVWAADLPEWTDLANGSVTTLRMKVTFNRSMPHGSYDSWFGVATSLVCGVENLSPMAAHLSPFTYSPAPATSPAAPATTRPAHSSPAAAPTHTAGGAGNASTAADASGTTSAHAPTGSAGASASGSVGPSASGLAAIGASASPSGSAPTTLTNAQNAAADRAASSSGSGSGTLVWVLVLGALVVFGGVGGTLAARRRRSRT